MKEWIIGILLAALLLVIGFHFYGQNIQIEDAQFSLWVGNHQPTKWGGVKPEVTGIVYSGMDGNNHVFTIFTRGGTFPVYIPAGTREFRLMGREVRVLEEPNPQNFQFILKGG